MIEMSSEKSVENKPNEDLDEVKSKKRRRKLTDQEKKWSKTAFLIAGLFLILFIIQLIYYMVVYSWNDWVAVLVIQIVLIMPAYWANAFMLVVGGGPPLDRGKISKDGRRLFGPGKTIRGFFLGPAVAIVISMLIHWPLIANWDAIEAFIVTLWDIPGQYVLFDQLGTESAIELYKVYLTGALYSQSVNEAFFNLFFRVTVVAYGAALGDLMGSWLKRRLNRKRGEPIWIVDQIDFIVVVMILTVPFVPFNWQFATIVIFTLLFTPTLTVVANLISYSTGHKSVPY